jgi:hypothetical protein
VLLNGKLTFFSFYWGYGYWLDMVTGQMPLMSYQQNKKKNLKAVLRPYSTIKIISKYLQIPIYFFQNKHIHRQDKVAKRTQLYNVSFSASSLE